MHSAARSSSSKALWSGALHLGWIAYALRDAGPCSEWFDNAWLKSFGYSADVCCWRNHTDCWQDGHSYATCCEDYDTEKYDDLLVSLGHASAVGALAGIALPLAYAGGGSMLNGVVQLGVSRDSSALSATAYSSPREFFKAATPAAKLVVQAIEDRAVQSAGEPGGTTTVLFVMTAPGNFARRMAIRRTWLQTALWPGAAGTRYAFLVCAPDARDRTRIPQIWKELEDEQATFADVIALADLEDVYWGWEHTAKTFLALIAVFARAPEAMHFVCLHDDVYVYVPRLVGLLQALEQDDRGLYLGNTYSGHDFFGHSDTDAPDYEAMHGHLKMPPVMKGGLWVVDRTVASWVLAMMAGPAALLPWRLWPSDDDSIGLVFGELDLRRVHSLRHGIEWFDWRLDDVCDGAQLVVAHDLKTPRELFEMWVRHLAYDDPCYGLGGSRVRQTSRPEDFV